MYLFDRWAFSPLTQETMLGVSAVFFFIHFHCPLSDLSNLCIHFQALWTAINTYRKHKVSWEQLMKRGMEKDFSWDRASAQYEQLFEWAFMDPPYSTWNVVSFMNFDFMVLSVAFGTASLYTRDLSRFGVFTACVFQLNEKIIFVKSLWRCLRCIFSTTISLRNWRRPAALRGFLKRFFFIFREDKDL